MYTILRAKNEGLAHELVAFAQTLVQTPSPTLEEAKVADAVEQKLTEVGYDKVVRDDAGNVLGLILGRESGPTVLLTCHMDTAGDGRDDGWTSDPVSGHVEDGTLFGLGASDCKGGLAAQVFAGALLRRSLLPLKGNLVVAATVAEERGGSVGVRALMEQTLPELDIKPTFAILGEPTGLGLYYGHDGWAEFEVRVEGANPFQVDDATQAIFDELAVAGRSRQQNGPERLALGRPSFEDLNGARRGTIPMSRRLDSGLPVGGVLDQVKQTAELAARPAGSVAVDVLVREENEQLYTGQATVVRHVTHAWSTDPFGRLMERARQSLGAAGCEVAPGKWELGRLGMGTAGGVLVDEFNVPTIGYGPGLEATCHCPNERVSVDRVVEAGYGTAAIVHGLIGYPVFGWADEDI